MIRSTSSQAYKAIKDGGLLSKMRFEAYDCLYRGGPMTAKEMMQFAKRERAFQDHIHLYSLEKRLSELRDLGVIVETHQRPCRVTGMKAIVWEVSGRLPQKVERKKAVPRKRLELIARLARKVAYSLPQPPYMYSGVPELREALKGVYSENE